MATYLENLFMLHSIVVKNIYWDNVARLATIIKKVSNNSLQHNNYVADLFE